MTNLGIIGCGWIVEKAYLPVLVNMTDVVIYAVFDIDYQKARRIQEKYHILNASNNIYDFLSLPLDAVIIATPNNTHIYYANMALNTGKHVLCEKPVALLKKDVESIINIAQIKKKIFLPAFVNRFRKDVLWFGEKAALIDEIKEINVNWIRKSGIPRPGTWITNKAIAGGGALIDIGTHVIDIGLMLFPDKQIKSVKLYSGVVNEVWQKGAHWNNGVGQGIQFDVETWANGKVILEHESILRFNVSWASDVCEDVTNIKVIGNTGSVSINTLFGFSNDFTRNNIEIQYETNGEKKQTISFPMSNTFALDAFRDLVRYFLNTINGKTVSILKPLDSVRVVDVIEKLYQSVR